MKENMIKGEMRSKLSLVLGAFALVLLLIGSFVGVSLLRQSQDLRQQASTGSDQNSSICDAGSPSTFCKDKYFGSDCSVTSASSTASVNGQCIQGFGSPKSCSCMNVYAYGCSLGKVAIHPSGCQGWVVSSSQDITGTSCQKKSYAAGTVVTKVVYSTEQECLQLSTAISLNTTLSCGTNGMCKSHAECINTNGSIVSGFCAEDQICCSAGNTSQPGGSPLPTPTPVVTSCGDGGTCRTANLCNAANGTTIAGTCTSGYVCCKPAQQNASPMPSPTPLPQPTPVNTVSVIGCFLGQTAPGLGCENWQKNNAGVCVNNKVLSGQKVTMRIQHRTLHSCEAGLAEGVSLSACTSPTVTGYKTGTILTVPSFNYPAVIKTSSPQAGGSNSNKWSMFLSGPWSALTANERALAGANSYLYPNSQQSIWIKTSTDPKLQTWEPWLRPAVTILPTTSVAFKPGKTYEQAYPNGFKSGCTTLTGGKCNVQVADPSPVYFNGSMYLYFTIFENYRWYDGSLGRVANNNPTNPTEQNRRAVGLALSGDNGLSWAFIDKILPESGMMASNRKTGTTEDVLGAWSPSVVKVDDKHVDVYFHDSLGTKQYVARLEGGVAIKSITRLNPYDTTYRINLDVLPRPGTNNYEVMYTDKDGSIVRTFLRKGGTFDQECSKQVIVAKNAQSFWTTPHQFVDDGGVTHLYFWKLQQPQYVFEWVGKTN